MRLFLAFILTTVFTLSVLATEHHVPSSSHEGCTISESHADLSATADSDCPGHHEHGHCVFHCLHHGLNVARPFGLGGAAGAKAFPFPTHVSYDSPYLESLTPPPLKA